jgi:endonuclease/exonuclease/phosphatase (EEP) superfamily protein YafD
LKSPRFRDPRRAKALALSLFIGALAAVYALVGDRTLWGEWISAAPPMIWGVLLLPSAVRLRSGMLLAAIVLFVALTSEWPRLGPGAEPPARTLRVVSWNIGAGNGDWAEAVLALDPDVVFVQEGMKPAAIPEGYHWYGTLDPGTLSRFSAEVLPTESVGPWTPPQLLSMDLGETKVLVANVRLMLPSVVIQLVNPFEEDPRKNYRARVAQYGKLAALLESTAERTGARAILLAGDFNVPARMPSLQPLRGFLDDAWRISGSGWGGTVPEFLPLVRIDQLWLSRNIRPVAVRVVRLPGSDHRAVVADLILESASEPDR